MAPLCGRDVVHVFEGAARAAYGVCRVAAEAAVGAPDMASAPATATAPTASRHKPGRTFIVSLSLPPGRGKHYGENRQITLSLPLLARIAFFHGGLGRAQGGPGQAARSAARPLD